MDFRQKLEAASADHDSLLCVGLDPDTSKMPPSIAKGSQPLFTFNQAIIDATAELVCAFKLNSAMYEATGEHGVEQLHKTCRYLQKYCPDVPIILDFKRGDIGNTNTYYAQFAFDNLGVDAITISPYLGREANEAFLSYKDKGIIVLCRTSNPGAGEFQDLMIDGRPLYVHVAKHVRDSWNENGNCHLVVGAPYPVEMAEIRQLVGDDMIILAPGVGTQAGSVEATIKAGINSTGTGLIINASRDVIYASSDDDFVEAARQKATTLRDEINKYRSTRV